jgi:fructose-bisphosphate aldolase, class II
VPRIKTIVPPEEKSMITLRSALQTAEQEQVALGHFNFSETTVLRAAATVARELNVPVLVGLSEGEREFLGVLQAAALVKSTRDELGHAIFLNADHTHSLQSAEQAAKAGFDMIVFDRSDLPFDENVAETRRAVESVKSIHPEIIVEGEIGYIGTSSAVLDKAPEGIALTTPTEAKQFVDATRVDILAPAVGNMHGMLASMVSGETRKHLDIPRIAEIKKTTGVFLTLHGGSGTVDRDFQLAVRAGVNIIHINTELRVAWRRSLESSLGAHPGEVAPYKILPAVVAAVQSVVRNRLELFSAPLSATAVP